MLVALPFFFLFFSFWYSFKPTFLYKGRAKDVAQSRGSTRGSIESTNENPTASDRCRREGLSQLHQESILHPWLGTSFIISFADTWFVLVVRARASLLSLFYHFTFRFISLWVELGQGQWWIIHQKSSSTCSHSFHMAEKQRVRSKPEKHFEWKAGKCFAFQKHTLTHCGYGWMQMKIREMGMKNINFKKCSSYSSKKIESQNRNCRPPFGSACQLLGGGGIVTKLIRFLTGVYYIHTALRYYAHVDIVCWGAQVLLRSAS